MADMKIRNAPLRLTLTDDKGRVVASLRYPRVRWQKLVIESEDAEFDAVVLSDTRVRLVRRTPPEEGEAGGGESAGKEWDPFHEFEYGVRDMVTKAGKAVEDFLEDLNEWSGASWRRMEDESDAADPAADAAADATPGTDEAPEADEAPGANEDSEKD
jgi:hypothetical protein